MAYLALKDGHACGRRHLAELLWPDRPEGQARDSLKQSLSAIRQLLRDQGVSALNADRETISLDPKQVETDALEFARAARSQSDLGRAAAFYVGEFMEGFDGGNSELDTWLRIERERLHETALDLLDRLSSVPELDETASTNATKLGRYLVAKDPTRETAYRALMRLYRTKGDRAEALKTYVSCRAALRQELATTPDAKTEELYRDILTNQNSSLDRGQRTSIVVLVFDNLSNDERIGMLCEGLTEDIIVNLGRFRSLFVIDRHTAIVVSKTSVDMAALGRRLNVTHVIQGSVQRLSDRLRLTVRLVEAENRIQLWAHSYDISISDIVSIPERITGSIVASLNSRIETSVVERSRRKPILAAHECVLQGVKRLRGYGADDNGRAFALFKQALEIDPDFALANAYHALAEVIIHDYEAPAAAMVSALALAQRAVELDPDDSRCHWILAQIHRFNGDFRAAQPYYERAIAINPNDANAQVSYGRQLATLGRYDEGIERIRESMRLNPHHPDWYWQTLGAVLYVARRYEDAADVLANVTHAGFWYRCYLAASYAQLGRIEEAKELVQEARRLREDCSLSKLRVKDLGLGGYDLLIEGLRKAGMPE